jgi:taurine dioxygenase
MPVLADDGPMETVTLPQVRKSGGLIGAELSGLDLTREYPDETYQAILRAWAEHGVIFLRDQQLDAEQRDAFASRLGEIRVRQELRKEPEQTKAVGEGWHTDMTCYDEPPKATILFCQEVPPWGGDTQWAAMGPTFEGLSAGLQATLQVPLGAGVDRDVGQPADVALRGQRLPGPAPGDAPHPAERFQAGPGRLEWRG